MSYQVYMVECSDKSLYTGVAISADERLLEHNGKSKKAGAKYTATRQPVKLLYTANFPDRSSAMKEEAWIKKLKREEKEKFLRLRVVRAYEKPKAADGKRILVDRLWPRALSKDDAKIDDWLKDLTPSTALRKWYHEDKQKNFNEFRKRYEEELLSYSGEVKLPKKVTLVTGVKDIYHSHIPTLVHYLTKHNG
jgi:uncharacterized protein YeaO (DUF488 family)